MSHHHDREGALSAVVEAARCEPGELSYPTPVIEAAAALLTDLWVVAGRHGIRRADIDVARACLNAVDTRWRGWNHATGDARSALAVLLEELAQLGVAASLHPDRDMVVLERDSSTPTWGHPVPPRLAVTIVLDGVSSGWYLALYPHGTLLSNVPAPNDRAGAAVVAAMARKVNAPTAGTPRCVTPDPRPANPAEA